MTSVGVEVRFAWLFVAVSVIATAAVLLAIRAARHGSAALAVLAALAGLLALVGLVVLARIVVVVERQGRHR